ncbi:MAG: hypothetical protein LLG04_12795, partial [Parachlamydia sp.]|nr:hypothetical protein [Parachlamydia sp.]
YTAHVFEMIETEVNDSSNNFKEWIIFNKVDGVSYAQDHSYEEVAALLQKMLLLSYVMIKIKKTTDPLNAAIMQNISELSNGAENFSLEQLLHHVLQVFPESLSRDEVQWLLSLPPPALPRGLPDS